MEKFYPLEGVRVIALDQYIAGPYCSMWLADAGAEVIKVERPGTGEPRRSYLPAIENSDGEKVYGGFVSYNRNKQSITLDLQTEKGREIYKELVREADVVIENLKPGAVDKLGIGYDDLKEINPKVIYAAISGYGRMKEYQGIYSKLPAFDPVIQAMGGIMHLVGEEDGPPLWGFYGLADLYTGTVTAYQVMLALFMRERTGVGQFIDSSMYDSLVSLNERAIMLYSFTGEVATRGKESFQAPAGNYQVKDGSYVSLIVPNEMMWQRFCKAIDREDLLEDPRTKTGKDRARNKDFLQPIVTAWFGARSKEEVSHILNEQGVPVGPVQTSEDLINCPHLKARNMLLEITDPVAGMLKMARTPVRMSRAKEVPAKSAPRLGENTVQVLKQILNYEEETILKLSEEGII